MRKLENILERVGIWLLACSSIFIFILASVAVHQDNARSQPTAIGPANPILCNLGIAVTGNASLTQVLAAKTGQIVVICGWSFTNTAASGTFLIDYGTGSNCGTGTTAITPTLSVGTSAVTDHSPTAVISTPISQAICVNATATITGMIWAAQF